MPEQIATMSDRTHGVRAIVGKLSDLASFFHIDKPEDDLAALIKFVGAVADQAEIAVLNDEHTISDVITDHDSRLRAAGLEPYQQGLTRDVRLTIFQIDQAIADQSDKVAVLTEIGEAMIHLARLSILLGEPPLKPLRLAVSRAAKRIRQFEFLRSGTGDTPDEDWRLAKVMADR